jgi:uracil-DNA glycosylase
MAFKEHSLTIPEFCVCPQCPYKRGTRPLTRVKKYFTYQNNEQRVLCDICMKQYKTMFVIQWKSEDFQTPYRNDETLLYWTKLITPFYLSTWSEIFEDADVLKNLQYVSDTLAKTDENAKIFPPMPLVWSAFQVTCPQNLKVVIVGEDPYTREGQACGLSFSVMPGIPVPPSLENIFRELSADGFNCSFTNGNLQLCAMQGVLLLNTSLTIERSPDGDLEKHLDLWNFFIQRVFAFLNARCRNLVFMLWGKHAQQYEYHVDHRVHKVIKSSHPSPKSAHRACGDVPAFIGSRPFSRANTLLTQWGIPPVNWNLFQTP